MQIKHFSLACFLFISQLAIGQQGQRPPQGAGSFKMPNIARVYGKLIEKDSKEPVAYASVAVYQSMGKKDSLLNGALTLDNGEFSITQLPFGRLKVKVTFMGFKEYTQFVVLAPPDNVEVDMGDLRLETDAKVLQAVDVTAQKSSMQLAADKKVFNVEKDINSQGGTAEDVLKRIPSVTVDADGNTSLRNQSTMIYVDGKPTPLSINQIASDQIESVEVITNPSAKFEAATSGGIINIVLKKNKKPGYNGFIGLGIGTGNRYNSTANLNVKQGKFNVTSFFSFNSTKNPTEGYTRRTTYTDATRTTAKEYYDQTNNAVFGNRFLVGRMGVDYYVNNRNTFTVAGNYVQGQFNVDETQPFYFQNLPSGEKTLSGTRTVVPRNRFDRYQAQMTWRKSYPKKGKELVADATYDWGTSTNKATWTTVSQRGTNAPLTTLYDNKGGNKGDQFVFQLDFTNPINDSTKVEMGARSYANLRTQDYLAYQIIETKAVLDSALSSNQRIDDYINAAYITYSSRFKGFNYQAGVRYEQSNFRGTSLLGGETKFGYDYPSSASNILNAFFPSLYLSKKLDKKTEIQINFSRKINRPNFMQIMPFAMFSDSLNVRQGNPALLPEFINLMEFNYNKLFKTHNFLASLYWRNEENPIVNIANRSTTNPNLLINTFFNAEKANKVGTDMTLKLAFGKNAEWTNNVNAFYINYLVGTQNISGFAYTGKSNFTYRFPKDISVQVSGNYESEQPLPQGTQIPVYFMDLSVKKSFMKVASVSLTLSDVFDTRGRGMMYNFETINQDMWRRRETRYVRLNLQVPFGKMDASIFKRRPQQRQGGGQEMDF